MPRGVRKCPDVGVPRGGCVVAIGSPERPGASARRGAPAAHGWHGVRMNDASGVAFPVAPPPSAAPHPGRAAADDRAMADGPAAADDRAEAAEPAAERATAPAAAPNATGRRGRSGPPSTAVPQGDHLHGLSGALGRGIGRLGAKLPAPAAQLGERAIEQVPALVERLALRGSRHVPHRAGRHGDRGEVGPTRSTSAFGRAVVADALADVDPRASRQALMETDWRRYYPLHFRRLLEAGLDSPEAAVAIASAGLASVHDRMRWIEPGGAERPLRDRPRTPPAALDSVTLHGVAEPEQTVVLPYRGGRLVGDDLRRQLDRWVAAGVMEPDAGEAVRRVMANPPWLRLPGRTAVVIGAGAQLGPLVPLLRWGAEVAALDVPGPGLWRRILQTLSTSAGRLTVPMPADPGAHPHVAPHDVVGVDLTRDLPAATQWVGQLPGDLVVGNYAYADGAAHVLVSVAADALLEDLRAAGGRQVVPACLATPTDVFGVPPEVVAAAQSAFGRGQSLRSSALREALRTASGGRLLAPNYGLDLHGLTRRPAVNDSIVAQQGPNYLLAKRIQRWRATLTRAAGGPVAFSVAPPTSTRSVTKNRALAAAYAGADRFGVEVFEPATASTLMAVLLVHDLYAGGPTPAATWQAEARHAVHGGLWRTAYEPRSALGLAALTGLTSRG